MLKVAFTCSPQHWEGERRQADPMLSGHSAQLNFKSFSSGKGFVLIDKGENDLVKHLMSTSGLHMCVYTPPHDTSKLPHVILLYVKGQRRGELLVFGIKKIVSSVLIMLLENQ